MDETPLETTSEEDGVGVFETISEDEIGVEDGDASAELEASDEMTGETAEDCALDEALLMTDSEEGNIDEMIDNAGELDDVEESTVVLMDEADTRVVDRLAEDTALQRPYPAWHELGRQ